jgi:hypothetical protein
MRDIVLMRLRVAVNNAATYDGYIAHTIVYR